MHNSVPARMGKAKVLGWDELIADYKLPPCSLPFGPTSGRSKWFQTILWRAANPDKNAGKHFCTACADRRVSGMDAANDLIGGENSTEVLLKKIKPEGQRMAPRKKTQVRKVNA